MKEAKYPKIYNLQVKRSYMYSERRIEIDKETIKYYKRGNQYNRNNNNNNN